MDPQTTPAEETLNLIPIYRNPKIQGGVLPGKWLFSMIQGVLPGKWLFSMIQGCVLPGK